MGNSLGNQVEKVLDRLEKCMYVVTISFMLKYRI
jgi:hypothetical protein